MAGQTHTKMASPVVARYTKQGANLTKAVSTSPWVVDMTRAQPVNSTTGNRTLHLLMTGQSRHDSYVSHTYT